VVHAVNADGPSTRVGFVVSKAVGNAVVRNRVKRRLRHLAQPRVDVLREPMMVVVRALPTAATRPDDLSRDFASAWSEAVSRLEAVA
jgi:ribonuclease P protein component